MNSKTKYWLDLCEYDMDTAKAMLETKRYLYVGYMCHQIVEKSLKATIANFSDDIPPKTHDLQRLSVTGGVFDDLSEEQFALLDILKPLQIQARYPEHIDKLRQSLSEKVCKKLIIETEELLCWIKKRLEK